MGLQLVWLLLGVHVAGFTRRGTGVGEEDEDGGWEEGERGGEEKEEEKEQA
jgi:hypothetical protein